MAGTVGLLGYTSYKIGSLLCSASTFPWRPPLLAGVVHLFWSHNCKPCYPDSGWGRSLWPARYPGLGNRWCSVWAGESLYIEAAPLALRPHWQLTPEVLLTTIWAGTIWGLWIAGFAKLFTRSLGTALPTIRAVLCVWVGVGFLLLRHACSGLVTGGNAGRASLQTVPWGTQWGQLKWSPAAICALLRIRGGRLGLLL